MIQRPSEIEFYVDMKTIEAIKRLKDVMSSIELKIINVKKIDFDFERSEPPKNTWKRKLRRFAYKYFVFKDGTLEEQKQYGKFRVVYADCGQCTQPMDYITAKFYRDKFIGVIIDNF